MTFTKFDPGKGARRQKEAGFDLSTQCSKFETRTRHTRIDTFSETLNSFFALPIVKGQRQIMGSEFHSMLTLCGRHRLKTAQIHSILLSKCGIGPGNADAARRHYCGGDDSLPGGERSSQRRKRLHGTGMWESRRLDEAQRQEHT